MRAVRQKHKTGCGVAAVAMVAGVKYDDALKAVHPNYLKKKKYGTNWVQLREALLRLKVKYGDFKRTKTPVSQLATAAKKACIVGVAERTRVNKYHYLVISKTGKVYDPYFGKSVSPDLYPVVRSFLEVTPK